MPVAWEFGTFNTIKVRKSLESLRIMINENQGCHHGYRDEESKKKTMYEFRKLYYPDDETWRNDVLNKSLEVFDLLPKQIDTI